jgi:replicative superfamily II helicase
MKETEFKEIIKLGDQSELVPTNKYPKFASFGFENFNPVQSRVFEIYDKDCNVVIAARTSAGKTICAEMFMSHEVRVRGGKAIYLAPLRALAKEKIDDWQDQKHHFNDLRLSICTGDYRLTPDRKKELEESHLILMTSEMLNSRCRNAKSENNTWLKDIGTIVVDESHLLTVPGRGDHLEVGLMKLTQIAPHARIVFLSATMPNVDEIAAWLANQNKKQTFLLESEYRPCPLGIHWHNYFPCDTYEETEEEKVNTALGLLEDHPDDRFLMFVHTKRTGEMMKRAVERAGFECEFHNADLEKDKRHDVEKRFKSGKLQVIVATSTLAWGLNMPARRVVILGVHRGMSLVDTYDIWQMAGRAGRPGYDPRGDVYILLPEHDAPKHMERLMEHQKIISRLLDHVGEFETANYKTLAFHLISEIHHGYIRNKEEMHRWYERSLAHFQAQDLHDEIIDRTLENLIKCGAIKIENNEYKATIIGMIASMFYYSPFDVADLRRNFKALFQSHQEDNDLVSSICLGNIDSQRMGIVSKAERAEIAQYLRRLQGVFGAQEFTDSAVKSGFCYYTLMNGHNSGACTNTARTLQWDFPRLATVLNAIDTMSTKWEKKDYLKKLQIRVIYGVRSELADLCTVPDIGKVRAEKLYAAGIRTPKDILTQSGRLSSVLNLSPERVKKIMDGAHKLKT